MKKIILISVLLIVAVACMPFDKIVQKAIKQTQTALIPTATITSTSTFTPNIPPTPYPSKTPRPQPTLTPTPNYILETGFCIMSIKENEITGDPSNTSGCGVQERKVVYIGPNQSLITTFSGSMISKLQNYCALFDLDHNFIMYDLDSVGTGKVECYPK